MTVGTNNHTIKTPTVAVYSYEPDVFSCSMIRIVDPIRANNWNVVWAGIKKKKGYVFNHEVAYKADLIVIHRMFPSKYTESTLRFLINSGKPIIYDLDDLFLNVSKEHRPEYKQFSPYIKWILKEADAITVSTDQLKIELAKHTRRPIFVNQNIINFDLFYSKPRESSSHFNFLISGTPSHQRDWAIIEGPILDIINLYKEKVKFIFFGDTPEKLRGNPSIEIIEFQPNYTNYAIQLKEIEAHAALIPLVETNYNNCKSNIKWLEYSAAGIPGIYSDRLPYNSSVIDQHNGLLASDNPCSWVKAMTQLLENRQATSKLIENAQQEVKEQHSIETKLPGYMSVFTRHIQQKHNFNRFSQTAILHLMLLDNFRYFIEKNITWRFGKKTV